MEHLGHGGMAEVYKAHHPILDRYVAIKVLHPFLADEKDFLTRFQREAKIVATFRHPNIVQVYDFDFDTETNAYYMVMEFVDGPTLKTRLQELVQEDQRLALEETVRIVIAVANALDYAHQRGMVHRDIKPANIIFTQEGQIILSDFGIARMVNTSTLTATGAMVGTPAYMAPEQGMGQVGDERADIYSLGAVLYQLITGNLPFDADTPLGTVLKHINSPLTPPTDLVPSLSPGIEAVIVRSLAKDPDLRYQTAKEFAADLERATAGEPVEQISPELAMSPAITKTIAGPDAWGQVREQTPQATLAPATRPKRSRVAVLAAALVIILLGSVALFTTGLSARLFAALFPQTATPTPSVTSTPTLAPTPTPTLTPTPDLEVTHDFLSTQVATGVDAALATRDALETYEATMNAPTPTPTSTPDLTATALAACSYGIEVVDDRAVRPSILVPRQQFVKQWTIQNTGTCTWPEDVRLVFVSGDELDIVARSEIEPLALDESIEIQITLRAPASLGSYTSVWQLQHGEGNPIGEELEITYRVDLTPTPRSTATPTPTPTPEFTPTPVEPLWMSIPGVAECDSGKTRGRIAWGSGGGSSDEYRYFQGWVSLENELEWPSIEFTSFPHIKTYFTTSGALSFPIPENCCPNDSGRYVSPEGYEIVWHKVWQSPSNCPQ
ncbi:MAG: protein kinase [Anaerolineae bacterium]